MSNTAKTLLYHQFPEEISCVYYRCVIQILMSQPKLVIDFQLSLCTYTYVAMFALYTVKMYVRSERTVWHKFSYQVLL